MIDPGRQPATPFDPGLQHERTALAWERTAIAMIVAGLVLSRYAEVERAWLFLTIGAGQTVIGAGLLAWAGLRYEDLHGPLREGSSVIYPRAVHAVAITTIAATTGALILAVLIAVRH